MKKILLTILAVMAMGGMAMAQDINLQRNEDGSWSFIMPARNLVMSTESYSSNDPNGHYLAGVPEGWLVIAAGDTVTITDGVTTPITEGAPVTIVPTGNLRRIKSITLIDAPKRVAEATAEDLGKVIGADGIIYDDAAAATAAGTTALAMIVYVGSETGDTSYKNGLAIAQTDESETMNWSTAKSTCEGKTPVTGAKWCLPSQNQWKTMFSANGGSETSWGGLNTTITTAGGTVFQSDGRYWSSTENESSTVYVVRIRTDGNVQYTTDDTHSYHSVRACLAF